MIFYHVSTDLKHGGSFKPRIPEFRHQQEDKAINRVSVAPTIEDCLTAIPDGGSNLDQLNFSRRGYYLVYRIDTEKLKIGKECIITSEELYEKDLCRDADITKEHWITTSFTVPEEDRFLILLNQWVENEEDVLPFSIFQLANEKFEGDYLRAYQSIYREYVPSAISIHDLVYTEEKVEKEEKITLYLDGEDEGEHLVSYIVNHLPAEIKDINTERVIIIMKESTNLADLYMHHAELAMLFY